MRIERGWFAAESGRAFDLDAVGGAIASREITLLVVLLQVANRLLSRIVVASSEPRH